MPAPPRPGGPAPRSPVLLLGAGLGEATCGILYLASYLQRHGVEARVRLFDPDESPAELARSLAALLGHLRPRLVGISLKWFHHLARARRMARLVRSIDPEVEVVLGGNSASLWWRELVAWDCVDRVVLGDGEAPLLALCRGEAAPPNVVSRATLSRAPLAYVQGAATDDVHYSHFEQLFLSQLDRDSFSGWVAPGKGCGENCVYCGGTRGVQQASFGRARSFLRPVESVRRDHLEVLPHTWQLRYDFDGSSTDFLRQAWTGLDLSRHATTYFLWGVPSPGLAATLASTFQRVFLVLDIGCFSQGQRQALMGRGLLKPCPTDAELMRVIDECRRFPNLQLELCGIAGLPFASPATLAEERALVERVLGLGCAVGYQRLEAQPGALATEHPGRFGMVSEATTFDQFLQALEEREGDGTVPMLRFADPALERAVQAATLALEAEVHRHAEARAAVAVDGGTRLVNGAAATREVALGDWLGAYRVPARLAREPVTVVRSSDGRGLCLAPGVGPRSFADPALQQGETGAALLAALEAFRRPTAGDAAVARLRRAPGLDAGSARELVEQLAAARFLVPG